LLYASWVCKIVKSSVVRSLLEDTQTEPFGISRAKKSNERRIKMKRCLAGIPIVAILLWSVPAVAAGDAAAGKELFSKKCASCHGPAGEGRESIAKMLKVELRPLGSKEVQAKSDADLKKNAVDGTGKMKPVTGIDAKGADDLVAYLRTLKK
jgi:mono/diheme cytochrome c family protein